MKKMLLFAGSFLLASFSSFSHNDVPAEVSFVSNKGQWNSTVLYKAQIGGGNAWLEKGGFSFDFYDQADMEKAHQNRHKKDPEPDVRIRAHAYRLKFIGFDPGHTTAPSRKAEGFHNYFSGADPAKWAGNVPLHHEVIYHGLYSGIDMKVYSAGGYFKYDYIIQAGVSPGVIRWGYEGAEPKLVKGRLVTETNAGEVKEEKPYAYQWVNGQKKEVECRYRKKEGKFSFEFPEGYDSSKELIIDPTLIFSTYTGSTADNWGFTATYDDSGSLYSGGIAFAAGYPTTVGAFDVSFSAGATDVAISKFTPSGASLVYSTYLGGNNSEAPHSLIVDDLGNLFVMGTTGSSNFPVTAGCYDNTFNGGSSVTPNGFAYTAGSDIFVAKFNPSGSALLAATFVGGTANDGFNISTTLSHNYSDEIRGEIVLGPGGEVYVGSSTFSTNFPTTPGSLATVAPGAQNGCAFKLDNALSTLIWSTYVGGTNADAVYSIKPSPATGTVYLTGGTLSTNFPVTAGTINPASSGSADGFVTALSDADGSLSASTYLGTAAYDQSYLLEIDVNNDIYVAGQTKGAYPVSPGVYSNPNSSQFIHKMNPALTATDFSTVFGTGSTFATNISLTAFLVDNCQNIYVSGWGGAVNTEGSTTGLPVTADAYDASTDGSDFYFIVLERDAASLLYGSFFGGPPAEHVDGGTSRFDKNGTIYQAVCAGCGGSDNFPTTPGAWSNTNNSTNCNLGALKMEFNYLGIVANANAAPNIIACDPPYDVNFTGSLSGVQHIWDFGDGSPQEFTMNPSHTFTAIGNYTVMYVAIDSSTCNIADTAYLTVEILAAEVFAATIDIPPYDTCTALSYDVNMEFTGSGADSIYWSMGDGTDYINDTAITHTYVASGTYVITMTAYDFTCGNVGTITDTVSFSSSVAMASANAAPNIIQCDPPFIVNFTGGTAPAHFWDFGDGVGTSTLANPSYTFTALGTFNVMYVVIDSSTCNITDTAYLTVQVLASEVFSATLDVAPYDPCVATNFTVNLDFTGTGADSLYWDMGDGTTYNDTSITHTYLADGTYIISLTAYDFTCGKVETITDTVMFNSSIVNAVATASPNVITCDPPYTVNYTGGTTPQHFWDFGDGTGTSTSANPSYTFTEVGSYSIMYVAIDSSTCNIADTVYLSVQVLQAEEFSATFTPVPPQPCKDTVFVNVNFTGTGADSLVWNMGDGTTFIGDTAVSYFYVTPGLYTVQLTAYDLTCNNIETISQNIVVDDAGIDSHIIIPNVFSPNGDDDNDEFKLFFATFPNASTDSYFDEYSMEIYNRWGKKIFVSDAPSHPWNGTINGKPADDGVYFYIIKYRQVCAAEEKHVETGHVTLVR